MALEAGQTFYLPGFRQVTEGGSRWHPVAHKVLSVEDRHVMAEREDGVTVAVPAAERIYRTLEECQKECWRLREGA